MTGSVRGVLLCAGSSTRFGSPKLLAPAGDGIPVAVHAARSLVAGAGRVLAVIRPGDEALRAALEAAGCEVLEAPESVRGMGASLAAAVAASREAAGWVVALGDMPRVPARASRAVAEALSGGAFLAAAVAPASARRGHPVGFSAALRAELEALDGDEGARAVVARHADRLVAVPVDDPGIFLDVDTPADLGRVA